MLYYAADYEAAVEQCTRTLDLDPRFVVALQWKGRACTQLGRHGEAVALHRGTLELLGDDPEALASTAHALAVGGRLEEARTLQARLLALGKERYVSPFWSALVATGLDEHDAAFDALSRACDERSDWVVFLRVEPVFRPLQTDPRYEALVHRMRLPDS